MLHDTIKRIREVHNLTQEEVAERLSLALRTYKRLETGETRMDWDRMRAIAEVYEMSPEDLIAFGDKPVIETFNVEGHDESTNGKVFTYNNYYGAEKELYEQLIAQLRSENELLRGELQRIREDMTLLREDMTFLREELVRARKGES